ncbi:inhibin beta B chain-like [Mytilus trossulus]|uniref:inhibin beta B chain-like n=1 Tax=Mytilus trossulus TaxID=6551 RepID=UPI00300499E8
MDAIYFYTLFMVMSISSTLQFGSFPAIQTDLERFKKLAAIKVRILNKIGLNDRPFVGKPIASGHVTGKLFGRRPIKKDVNHVNKPRGEYYAEIQEVVSHSQIPENLSDANVVLFKVVQDNQGRQLEVTSADLLVKIKYKRKKKGSNGRRKRLKVRTIFLKLSTLDTKGKPSTVVASVTTRIKRTKWLKVAVPSKVIENAMKRDDQNLYLHLNCVGCDHRAQLILINGGRNKKKRKNRRKSKKTRDKMRDLKIKRPRRKRRLNRTRPFLILHTKVKTYIRSKRETSICANNSACCMDNLLVDFKTIGWSDWIIAPKSFETGVCEGTCTTNHTCSETKSTHLRIVYYDNNGNIIFTSLPNMIVTECGCISGK